MFGVSFHIHIPNDVTIWCTVSFWFKVRIGVRAKKHGFG
jgi:hypothetical protein